MQNTSNNRMKTFLFGGNFNVYNATTGAVSQDLKPDFQLNCRIKVEFDTVQFRFVDTQNPLLHDLSAGRPYGVEIAPATLGALIAYLKSPNKPEGHVILAPSVYNQQGLNYNTPGYIRKIDNGVAFVVSNGQDNREFAVTGQFQIDLLIGYLESVLRIAEQGQVQKELMKLDSNSYSVPNAAPKMSAPSIPTSAPVSTPSVSQATSTSSPAPSVDNNTVSSTAPTSTPSTSQATPATTSTPSAAPSLDIPNLDIPTV